MIRKLLILFFLTAAVPARAAVVVCEGVNDTAAIQSAVDTDSSVTLQGACVVSGVPGVVLPSNRDIYMLGATVTQTANVGGTGTAGRNRVFRTAVGASNIHLHDGTVVGSHVAVAGIQFQIGFHIDSATNVSVEGTTFLNHYFDAITIGGNNPGSGNVYIRNVTISNSRRNAISITSGYNIRITGSTLKETTCFVDWKSQLPYNPMTACGNRVATNFENNMPLCAIDFEPNVGEVISDVVIMDNLFKDNQKCGIFLQSNTRSGGDTLIYNNRCEGNGTWCVAGNQVENVIVARNESTGGTLGYSFGSGLRGLVFFDNSVAGNTGNAANLAGVTDVFVDQFRGNGKPISIIAVGTPWLGAGTTMGGVAGQVTLRP